MRFCCSILAGALAAVLLLGCGNAGDVGTAGDASQTAAKTAQAKPPPPEMAWMTAEGWKGPTDVAILMAQELGYLEAAGIESWLGTPSGPALPVGYVANGTSLFGVVQQPQVALARSEGAPVVAIGSLVPHPTAAMIWLAKSKIGDVADLKGKTIAIPGVDFQERFLESVLERAGLTLEDVEVERVGYDLVPALLSGRADAAFGGSGNIEALQLESRGAKPVVTPVGELGIPAYEEAVVIARSDLVDAYPQFVRDFMTAVSRGARAARRHPRMAVEAVEQDGETDPAVSRKLMEAEMEATLPLLSSTGYMDPGRASVLVEWMGEEGMLADEVSVPDLLSNAAGPEG